MLTPENFIAQLRDKLSITDIIGKRVIWDTKKTNAKNGVFWACCPFHLEKTASFKVDQNKGFFYCFGCHEKGDSISFVMKTENLDFLTTVKRLATEVGLKLPISFGNNTFHKSESYLNVLKIQEIASFYFRDLLKNNPSKNATLFLKNRISNNEIIQNFRLGYASKNNNDLYKFLLNKGFKDEIIIKSGLCIKNEKGSVYDRFRDRIIFPIMNSSNKVVGFGGRALSSSINAKYLNSPETEVFHKGKLLFNENNCIKNLNSKNDVVIVEGYMDVVALTKIGLKNCMAPLGTAVTLEQLNKIWRISKTPIFAFDGDKSGIKALDRLVSLALPFISSEKTIQACILPDNLDPDDIISNFGKEKILKLLNNPKSLIHILWEIATKNHDFSTPEKRVQLEKKLDFVVNQINEKSLRHHYFQAFNKLKLELFGYLKNNKNKSNITSVNKEYKNNFHYLKKKMTNLSPSENTKKSLIANSEEVNVVEAHLQEIAIIVFLINYPDLIIKYTEKLNEIFFSNSDLEKIFEFVLKINSKIIHNTEGIIDQLKTKFGKDVYNKLQSTGPIKINPLLEKKISLDEASVGLDYVLTRKLARQFIEQELDEATDNISNNEDETLTWRIDQANKFLNQAISGKPAGRLNEKNRVKEDLNAINDLIKNQIWIKKNNDSNH